MSRWHLVWPLAAALATACAPSPVEVDLSFPSRDTFLYSDFARLRVYEVDFEMTTEDCPVILDRLDGGEMGEPVLDSDWLPVCEFRAGGVSFGDVPPGPHAYVVHARDSANQVILTGCRVAEVYEDAPSVEVQMFPTGDYEDATSGRELTCTTEEDKCRGGC